MLFAHVKAAYERLSFENVVWVGADEMNRRKGHNYLTVFADLLAKRVLFATPGKDASVWGTFAGELLQPVLGREAKGSWLSGGGVHDRHALLRRWETHPTVLLTHWKQRGTVIALEQV
jgi:hypothetical protein